MNKYTDRSCNACSVYEVCSDETIDQSQKHQDRVGTKTMVNTMYSAPASLLRVDQGALQVYTYHLGALGSGDAPFGCPGT